MPTLLGEYNYGPNFVPYLGVDPGPHLGPDLNGVVWSFVAGRHTGSNPDDFGAWVFGWLGDPFTVNPLHAFRFPGGHAKMHINPVTNNMLLETGSPNGKKVQLWRIPEAVFHT